jgi:hypothetical protein
VVVQPRRPREGGGTGAGAALVRRPPGERPGVELTGRRPCRHCLTVLVGRRSNAWFCSGKCRQRAYRRRCRGVLEHERYRGLRGRLRLDQLSRRERRERLLALGVKLDDDGVLCLSVFSKPLWDRLDRGELTIMGLLAEARDAWSRP